MDKYEDPEDDDAYIDGEDDDESEGEWDGGEDEEDIDTGPPSVLRGVLYRKGDVIVYEGNQDFCLKSSALAANRPWSIDSPGLDKAVELTGWIRDTIESTTVGLQITKETSSPDPLEQKLLDAQRKVPGLSAVGGTKKGEDGDSKDDVKEPSDGKPSASSPNKQHSLKEPPSYSKKEKPAATSLLKSPPNHDALYRVSGVPATKTSGGVNFTGLFRPRDADAHHQVSLFCSVQVVPELTASASAAPAAASRKRGLDDDEDSVENDDGVVYQELIGLHDDANLTTEELRKRYYGGGDTKESAGNAKRSRLKDDDEDDDDDECGF